MKLIEENGLRILQPEIEGNWLASKDAENPAFARVVYLGKGARKTDWREVTEAEKAAIEAEIESRNQPREETPEA